MAEIQLRFGTDEYKNAKAELQGYQTQLGSLTSQLQPCETNRDLQLQEYNDAVAYDGEYALAEENFASAEGELSQLNADMEKIEQSVKRNKDGEITSYRDANGDKIGNNDKATAEYDRQKSIIEQKIQTATHNREAAMQEKERIIQERNQKQLKETEVEKQEAETAEKELEELNQQINELNEKIIPLDEAIKQADEDKVDVAAQNNKNWDFYAEKELKAEGIENPSKSEIRARAEEIKQRNIDLGNCDKDGNLIVGKSIVTLTGKNNGVADGMATAEEAVGQYNSAIGKEASKAIESALGQLSSEEKAAYDSLPEYKKSAIQNKVLESINKGKGDNALSIIKQAVSSIVAASSASQTTQNSASNVLSFSLSVDNTMFINGYVKTSDGNYQKGDKLYKASGDMVSGVTVTEIGNAPVQNLSQEQQNTSQNLNTCRKAALAACQKSENVEKYSSATGTLNGLMYSEYSNICEKHSNLAIEMGKLGGYDSPNVSSQIDKVNRMTEELNRLCDAYSEKNKGMSESYYNVTNTVGAIPVVGIAGNALTAMGEVFDEFHTEDGLTLEETGKIVLEFCYNELGGKLLNKIPGFKSVANGVAQKAFKYCGKDVTATKIFEYLQNVGLGELKSALGL